LIPFSSGLKVQIRVYSDGLKMLLFGCGHSWFKNERNWENGPGAIGKMHAVITLFWFPLWHRRGMCCPSSSLY